MSFNGTINFKEECSICGKYFPAKFLYDEKFNLTEIKCNHNECNDVTKRIIFIKEQISKLKTELLNEEFTLFAIKMSKHNIDD